MNIGQRSGDFLDALLGARDRKALIGGLARELKQFGIGGYAYAFDAHADPSGRPNLVPEQNAFDTYPLDFEQFGGADRPDSTIRMLCEGWDTVDWTAPEVRAEMTPAELALQREYEDCGIVQGATLALSRDRRGMITSGIGLWFEGTNDRAAYLRERDAVDAEVRRLVQIFDVVRAGPHINTFLRLTDRERDALSWFAVGLRATEVAERMGITDRTVEKHIGKARDKLGAHTRDHAIAKAITWGLIEL